MTDRLPGAFTLSVTLHALFAGVMLLLNYAVNQSREDMTTVFEVVAGAGDNFAATEAPVLGTPDGIKVDVTEPPAPVPEVIRQPEMVAQPDPTPVTPTPPKPVEKAPPKPVDLSKQIERKVNRAEQKAKDQVAKARAAEEKKKSTMTKAEFDKQTKKATPPRPTNTQLKVAKVDTEGLRDGVLGGSRETKTGAGGTASTAQGTLMDRYYAMLQERLRAALEKPPGLSDTLVTVVNVRQSADGTLTGARITQSSGSDEFDRAALAAVAATRMPPRPDNKGEVFDVPFRMKERDEGQGALR